MTREVSRWVAPRRGSISFALAIIFQVGGLVASILYRQPWFAWLGMLSGLLMIFRAVSSKRTGYGEAVEELNALAQAIEGDCRALSGAVHELARGRIAVSASAKAKPVDSSRMPMQLSPMAERLNRTVTQIHGAVKHLNLATHQPVDRICYVGPDYYQDGWICGDTLGAMLSGRGRVLLTLAHAELQVLELRLKGCMSALEERYPGIEIADVIETSFDREEARLRAGQILEKYPTLTGIYVSDGVVPTAVAEAIADSGADGQVRIVCHDLIDENLRCLRRGDGIAAILSQDLFAQGYDSVVHLFNHLSTGWRPSRSRLLTYRQLITRDNYQEVWHPEAGLLDAATAAMQLAKPLRAPDRPVRIGVHNRQISGVDKRLQAGVLAAAARLHPFNASVEFIPGGILSVRSVLESAVAQRYDGLVLLAANGNDVSRINETAAAHLPIVSYNAEPMTLSNLAVSMTEQASRVYREPSPDSRSRAAGRSRSREQEAVAESIVTYMWEHLGESLTVADVAEAFSFSPSYMSRLVSSQTGRSPNDWLMDFRLKQAKQCLAHTDMSVRQVGESVGYDPSYFSRFFKRHVGCTPGEYAERMRA
jgi:ABC-type sugar transport system substrate-binding protein/AraC-like DNA-binding protein